MSQKTMKWFLGLVAAVLIGAFLYLQAHSIKRSYVNGLPEYTALPGQEYIFERACYLFKSDAHPSQYPLVGANFPELTTSVPALPQEVSEKQIGSNNGGIRILGTVHIGDRFRIVSVRRDETRTGVQMSFEILFIDEADRPYPRLDAYYLMNHEGDEQGKAPSILPDFAVQRLKK